jgi:hypothetical protein
MRRTDNELRDEIAKDPFHSGLEKHGRHDGPIPLVMSEFEIKKAQSRVCSGNKMPAMSDNELKAARSKLSRMCINGKLGLFLTYIGTLALMAKTYA